MFKSVPLTAPASAEDNERFFWEDPEAHTIEDSLGMGIGLYEIDNLQNRLGNHLDPFGVLFARRWQKAAHVRAISNDVTTALANVTTTTELTTDCVVAALISSDPLRTLSPL